MRGTRCIAMWKTWNATSYTALYAAKLASHCIADHVPDSESGWPMESIPSVPNKRQATVMERRLTGRWTVSMQLAT